MSYRGKFIDRYGASGFRLRKLVVEDLDNDGVNNLEDCDDNNSTMPNNDMDCDGVSNDSDSDADGDGVNAYDTDGVTLLDCDDADVGLGLVSDDLDCDGIFNDDDVVVTDGLLLSTGNTFSWCNLTTREAFSAGVQKMMFMVMFMSTVRWMMYPVDFSRRLPRERHMPVQF